MKNDSQSAALTFGVGESWLGTFPVASGEKGIRAILFGNNERELIEALGREFPSARSTVGGQEYGSTVAAVRLLIAHPRESFKLPLDTSGGDFEQITRAAIGSIPAGRTATLAEMTQMIGASRESARYVANVHAKDILAVAVPCHRADGITGINPRYRWGEERRRALRMAEAAA
jgi:O6-methylguanine-DNA--protein-cysteine methyltransferase